MNEPYEVGTVYDVVFLDGCLEGGFRAALTAYDLDTEAGGHSVFEFNNGVKLEGCSIQLLEVPA
jgi:hypothetical protein